MKMMAFPVGNLFPDSNGRDRKWPSTSSWHFLESIEPSFVSYFLTNISEDNDQGQQRFL
jgi:hypothetical protein